MDPDYDNVLKLKHIDMLRFGLRWSSGLLPCMATDLSLCSCCVVLALETPLSRVKEVVHSALFLSVVDQDFTSGNDTTY